MRIRDLGFGSLNPWPPQKCFLTSRLSVYGIASLLQGTNLYVAICERTRKAMIVDFTDNNVTRWGRGLEQLRANVESVVFTHCQDNEVVRLLKQMSFATDFNFLSHSLECSEEVNSKLSDQQIIQVGELSFKCLHTPGPSPGHCIFYEESEGVAFTGDILIRGGRLTRPIPDPQAFHKSLSRLVKEIPETTILFPGKYGLTTMGAERRMNPNLMGLKGPSLMVSPEHVGEQPSFNTNSNTETISKNIIDSTFHDHIRNIKRIRKWKMV